MRIQGLCRLKTYDLILFFQTHAQSISLLIFILLQRTNESYIYYNIIYITYEYRTPL